ncbi:hypothetical protein GGR26_002199 [Lewinella marina]|uniref:Secretion system C-terminal sorting domain-containing protein n=1 Tax=Neolewinella marina TaxID=438751 RepID=A0A2G0CGR1_9BACT|nr:T9SS type A sorting domain-containing protein [Neolewinella marina]NJB86431.1 hypothetical protein [Neolewinella marina]PHK99107.1 hypothetical protein CGL56_06500 [Neolewinella marina]
MNFHKTLFLTFLLIAMLPSGVNGQQSEDYFAIQAWSPVPEPYVANATALDLGADGDLDIVYPNRNELTVLENDGAGNFTQRPGLRTLDPDLPIDWPRDLAVADFNGDGIDDLFIADHGDEPAGVPFEDWPGGQSHLFLQTAEGKLVDVTADRLPRETSFTHATAVGDVTGDGAPDIFLASYVNIGSHPEARFYINDGTGHFSSEPSRIPHHLRQNYPSAELADIDLDGDLDLILGGNPVQARDALLLNDGSGQFSLATETALPLRFADSEIPAGDWRKSEWATWNIEAADFNADGYPDLVMGTLFDRSSTQHPNSNPGLETRIQLLLNQRDGTFRDATELVDQDLAAVAGYNSPWVLFSYPTDLNDDGFTDLVVNVWNGGTRLFYNDRGQRFIDKSELIPQLVDSWTLALPGDFTGDGAIDLAVLVDRGEGPYLAVNKQAFSTAATNPEGPQLSALEAFPNPGRSSTTIRYSVQSPGKVTIEVFDLLGQRVATLADGRHGAGEHSIRLAAPGLADGEYVVTMTTQTGVSSVRVSLVR